MEPLVEELIKNHENDKNLTGTKVQEEVKKLRIKHKRIVKELEDDEQLVGLDWRGAPLEGFHFENTKLSKKDEEKQAHFEMATLSNANFKKANLSYGWINQANVKETIFEGCNFIDLDFEDSNYFETARLNKIDESEYSEANKVYLELEKYFNEKLRPDRAAKYYFYRKELLTRHCLENWKKDKSDIRQLLAFIYHRAIGFICGYFERPKRVLRAWIITIMFSSILYFIFWGGFKYITNYNIPKILNLGFNSFYFSCVTFTTLGFGDLYPDPNIPLMKLVAMIEAGLGAFLMALFVVTLSRKMTK